MSGPSRKKQRQQQQHVEVVPIHPNIRQRAPLALVCCAGGPSDKGEEELFGRSPLPGSTVRSDRSASAVSAPSSPPPISSTTSIPCSQGSSGSAGSHTSDMHEILEENHREVRDLATQALSIRDTLSDEDQITWDMMFSYDRECVKAMFNMQKMRSDLFQRMAGSLAAVKDELVRVKSERDEAQQSAVRAENDLTAVKAKNQELQKEIQQCKSMREKFMQLAKEF